jgi:hypothetical protein
VETRDVTRRPVEGEVQTCRQDGRGERVERVERDGQRGEGLQDLGPLYWRQRRTARPGISTKI